MLDFKKNLRIIWLDIFFNRIPRRHEEHKGREILDISYHLVVSSWVMEKSNIVEFITFTSMTQIWVHYPVSRILDIETVATVVKRNAWWVRDVRDYRIHSDREKAIITDGSVFNIEGIYESAY